MAAEAKADSSISYLLVFKRDLRITGVTLVMFDGVIDPSTTG